MVFLKSGGLFGRGFAPFDPPLVLGVFLALDRLPPLAQGSKPPKFALLGGKNLEYIQFQAVKNCFTLTTINSEIINSLKLNTLGSPKSANLGGFDLCPNGGNISSAKNIPNTNEGSKGANTLPNNPPLF